MDNKIENKLPSKKKKFLARVATGMGIAGLAIGLKTATQNNYSQPNLNPESTAKPTALAEGYLKMTATAVEGENLPKDSLTSFAPEGKFTRGIFDKVRRSVFMINMLAKDEDGNLSEADATAWIAKNDGNHLFLVTNNHVTSFIDGSPDYSIELTQPGTSDIDLRFEKKDIKIATVPQNPEHHELTDLSVIMVKIPDEYRKRIRQLSALSYNANPAKEINKGDKTLTVGYPYALSYQDNSSDHNQILMGTIATVNKDFPYIVDQVMWGGGSGSPVFKIDSYGNPIVMGTIWGASDDGSMSVEIPTSKLVKILIGKLLKA